MKTNFFLSIVLLSLLITSCSNDDDYFGSGNTISENRNVNSFTKLSSEGTFIINIYQGPTQSVEVIADENIMSRVKTSVLNNELRVYLSDGKYSNVTLEANITVTNLSGLKNSGSGDINVYELNSLGNIDIDNLGNGSIIIDGHVSDLNIRNEGSGDIMAFDFFVKNCSIDIEGSGSVEINCSDNLDVDIEGSGNVFYKGNPAIDTNISGSGLVINSN